MKKYLLGIILLLMHASATFAESYTLLDTIKKDTTIKTTAKIDSVKFIPNQPIVAVQLDISSPSSTTQTKGGKTTVKSATIGQNSLAQSSSLSSGSDAGRTVGSLDVSGSGAATYTVPIAVPPGISGVAPQIALTYNSQGGPGIAGYGWNISGISAITCIPQTLFHDGVVGGVTGTINDRYALDGQRLLLKSGTYGADGAEYQTENYSNIRIISHGSMGTGLGPQYFEVYYPDGSHAIFGQNTDSFSKNTYAINYIDNPINTRISYTYTKSNETLVISHIDYGALSSGTPINQISFAYTTRTRNEQSYINGTALYQTSLLTEINVKGSGGTGYRNYILDHDYVSSINYDRLTGIQEKSGDGTKTFDPITFTYESTVDGINPTLYVTGLTSVYPSNAITADFTGDGKADILSYYTNNEIYLTLDPAGGTGYSQPTQLFSVNPFDNIFPVSTLDADNRLFSGQGFTLVNQPLAGQIKFQTYLPNLNGTSIAAPAEKVWSGVPQKPRVISNCLGGDVDYSIPRGFFSGDFNGDGLTDIISVSRPYTYITSAIDDGNGGCEISTTDVNSSTVHFINLDRRVTTGFVNQAGTLSVIYDTSDEILTADFNGDGKTDLIHIRSGAMDVYSLDASNNLFLIWSTTDGGRITTGVYKTPLVGDFNGDGKSDIILYGGGTSFYLFTSKGNSFYEHDLTFPFTYNADSISGSTTTRYYLTANDVNGDGKTDIISSVTTQTSSSTTVSATVYNNSATSSAGEPTFTAGSTNTPSGSLTGSPTPLFFNNNETNYAAEYGFFIGTDILLFRNTKDNRKEVALATVSQNGVDIDVDYKIMLPGTSSGDIPLYKSTTAQGYTAQTYPYIDIEAQPGFRLVSQLKRTYGNDELFQYFGYYGAVTRADGLGFLGFHETVKSNWITGTTDNNRRYSTTVYDPLLRGAVLRTFVSKDPFASTSSIKNKTGTTPDIELHSAVTSAQTIVAANSIILNPGFSADGTNGTFIAKLDDPVNGIDDGASGTLSDYVTRTDYTSNTNLLTTKVFINMPIGVVTKDMLNKTNTIATYGYDGYYNVNNESTTFSNTGTKTLQSTYANNPSGNYYGRLTDRTVTSTIGGDSFSTQEHYDYSGSLISEYKHKGNGTPYITEDYIRDSYGNITTKTVSTASDGSRSVSMAYDGTGRFNTSVTDVQGLTTTIAYDAVTGNITSKINPYSQTTGYAYDVWGRPTVTTNHLSHTNTRSYTRSGTDMIIADAGDDGSAGSTTINSLGQTTHTNTKDVLGQVITKEFGYDIYGRKISETEPGIGSGSSQANTTEYDEYDRIKKLTDYTTKVTSISYNNLQTTVDDGTNPVTTTKDAMGNVVSTTDLGGTITNTYFGNGNLKSADYGGSTQTIEQDGWGHKIKLTDPSAGVYSYTYSQFGDIHTETTPKGTTTYTYNTDGSIAAKNISGDNTSMAYTYTYNTNKTLHIIGLTNGDGNNTTYTYGYDSNINITGISEVNPQAEFTKTLTYDTYGRVANETNQAKNVNNSLTQSKTITNTYQYGQLKEITDYNTGQSIWKADAMNARGQVTTALLGSNVKQTNTFDSYGYPNDLKTEKSVSGSWVTQQDLTYTFDAQHGNVTNRKNYAFSPMWEENFSYDTQDRLTNYNDVTPSPAKNHSQSYDSRGRINNNSQVGDYTYTGTSYQQNKITNPSAFALYHYQQQPLQQVTYNAFKEPVTINEQNKEIIDFQYNGAEQRAHMYYGSTNTDKTLRPYRRHYSTDGSIEITEDLPNSKTSFVFYLGGDAYTAPAIWKYEQTATTTTTNALYYLLRDNLGSITMITDAGGNLMEKRQFDAWGNVIMVANAGGLLPTPTLTFLDRGYTGHEHLQGVGLVNMNARLYDPILHRFLSPDGIIQDPFDSQNYNRYSYVLNNPLKYTDPSGNKTERMLTEASNIMDGGGGGGGSGLGSFFNPWLGNINNPYGSLTKSWQTQDIFRSAQAGNPEATAQILDILGPSNYRAYDKLLKAWNNGYNIYYQDGVKYNGTWAMWNTGNPLEEGLKTGSVFFGGNNVHSSANQGHTASDYVGLAIGAVGTYYGTKAEAFHNALYWVQKNGVTRLTSTAKSNYTFQRSFNLIEDELSTVKAVSKYAGLAGVAVSGVQFINNRSYANAFDLAMSGTAFIPGVGWAISGAYFIGNTIDQGITGHSIGQQIFGNGHF